MMKKLLYLLLIVPFISNAQFWTDKATSFATAARGVNGISIVDANTVWVKAFDGSGGASNTVQEYAKSTDGGNTWTSGVMESRFRRFTYFRSWKYFCCFWNYCLGSFISKRKCFRRNLENYKWWNFMDKANICFI